jgi:hypothetical protein
MPRVVLFRPPFRPFSRLSSRPLSRPLAAALAAALALSIGPGAQAAGAAAEAVGPYAGVAVGASQFNVRDGRSPKLATDEHDRMARLYAGYQFEQFGLELGTTSYGTLRDSFRLGDATVRPALRGSDVYLAVTARLGLTENLSLTSRLGVARGRVSGSDPLPANDALAGRSTALLAGLGLSYRVSRDLSLTADLDLGHKLAPRVGCHRFNTI